MNARSLIPHAGYVLAAAFAVVAAMQQCAARSTAEQWGADKLRLKQSDSTLAELRMDSARIAARIQLLRIDSASQAQRIARLRTDSSVLAQRAAALQVRAQVEFERWQRVLAGWQVFADSIPGLRELLNQGSAAIASCQAEAATCETRRLNAETKAAENETKWLNAETKAANLDTARMNAEDRASENLKQKNIWKRRAQPSLWEQIKAIPDRVFAELPIVAGTWLACSAIK